MRVSHFHTFLGAALLPACTNACIDAEQFAKLDIRSIIEKNNQARAEPRSTCNTPTKIAIDNVRVFDGFTIGQPRTVVIDGGVIGTDSGGAHHINAKGATLLPGLMDAHCHPSNITHLESLTQYGVTTGFHMACFEPEMCTSLQNHSGLVDIITTSAPATAPGSSHGKLTALVDSSLLISNASQVPAWVERQLAGNPDYFKLVAEIPGLSQAILNDLTDAVHQSGKMVAIHAAYYDPFDQAIKTRCDHIQHSPLDKPITEAMARQVFRQGQTSTPTLTMMRNTAANLPQNDSYIPARDSVTLLHKAGVPILVGTDANLQAGVPATVPFGISVHDEMDNLVEAGMSNLEALRAATVLPALHYGLHDRGRIASGMRADLVLVDGNPLDDIRAARNIQRVWVAGVEYFNSETI